MGMFDTIRWLDPLPDGFDGVDCQTKSFPEPYLNTYFVKDGELFTLEDYRSQGKPLDWTGEVRFHDWARGAECSRLTRFVAVIVHGKVESVEREVETE